MKELVPDLEIEWIKQDETQSLIRWMPWSFIAINLRHIGDSNLVNVATVRDVLKDLQYKTIVAKTTKEVRFYDVADDDKVLDMIQTKKNMATRM